MRVPAPSQAKRVMKRCLVVLPFHYSFGNSLLDFSLLAPTGEVLAALEEPEEGYVVVRLDLDEIRRRREETQIMLARQPGSYRPIVKKY